MRLWLFPCEETAFKWEVDETSGEVPVGIDVDVDEGRIAADASSGFRYATRSRRRRLFLDWVEGLPWPGGTGGFDACGFVALNVVSTGQ